MSRDRPAWAEPALPVRRAVHVERPELAVEAVHAHQILVVAALEPRDVRLIQPTDTGRPQSPCPPTPRCL